MKKHILSVLALAILIFSLPAIAQNVVQIAGTGQNGYNGSGLPALATELNRPGGIAFDKKGVIYFADNYNNLIRKIDALGNIITVAGNNINGGYNGDGIAATLADLDGPAAITFDTAGNLYIAELFNERVRKVDTAGVITTVTGTGSTDYNGDGILAVSANLFSPSGIAFDAAGNMYITEQDGYRVRKVNTNGYISTVVGNGIQGYSGDNGVDTNAEMNEPYGICVDNTGNIYVTDIGNGTVRKVDTAGIITTVAGTGVNGYNGDGIAATTAELFKPEGVVVDDTGNIYIADGANNRIREVNSKGIISTLISDTGQIAIANLGFETAVNRDSCGNLYFIDGGTNSVIWGLIPPIAGGVNPPSPSVCNEQNVTLTLSGNGTTYAWSPATGLSATTGDSVVAKPLVTTTYTVTSYSSCMAASKVIVTVIASPNKPTFRQHGDTLISSSMHDNQWYRNDTLLTKDTTQDLIITVLGDYWVVVNNEANGCSTSSDTMKIDSVTGVNQLSVNNEQLSIYPNPSSGQFTIQFNGNQTNYSVEVYSIMGEKIYQSVNKSPLGDLVANGTNPSFGGGAINLSSQLAGMYFVYLKSEKGVEVEKILITK